MIQDHERKVLEQFQKEIIDEGIVSPGDTVGTDDVTLLRFLRARKLEIEDAKKMLTNCQKWRTSVEDVGMDALYDEVDPLDYPDRRTVTKHWPFFYHKTDKEGHPIHFEGLGRLDIAPLSHEPDLSDRLWKALLTNAEFGPREAYPACSRAKGTPVSSTLCLADMKGFSLQRFWSAKDSLKELSRVSKDYYPETMAKLILINVPAPFTFVWNIAKKWLEPETRDKVVLLGSDYRSFLLEIIDEENLPTEYGGTCTCEDLGGCAFSNDGPWLEGRVSSRYRPRLQQETDKALITGTNTCIINNDKEIANGSMPETEVITKDQVQPL